MTRLPNSRLQSVRFTRSTFGFKNAISLFLQFKWFTLILIVLLPLYPSLSLIGTGASAYGVFYDESSIITAFSDDSLGDDNYFSESGMIRVGQPQRPAALPSRTATGDILTTPSGADRKRAPQIIRYTVVAGDTLAKISEKYNVSIDAIRWANEVSLDPLKPGMIIKVPPTSGVVHTVKKGDTISAISQRYNIPANDIITFNQLADRNALRVGAELMIPGAQKRVTPPPTQQVATSSQKVTPIPQSQPTPRPIVVDNVTGLKSSYDVAYNGQGKGFVAGNCTWYVAQHKKNVDWRGNANMWIRNARAKGHKTGSTPVPGAIVQFSGRGYSRAYGHVGIVADVKDDHIIVRDMNYRGLYEVTVRKVNKTDPAIDGYIYVD